MQLCPLSLSVSLMLFMTLGDSLFEFGLRLLFNGKLTHHAIALKGPIGTFPIFLGTQVETIIELRAMHLEDVGKMSRYAPLIALESIK